ncbi:MAG: HAMP domain-containing protein [Betaproteobacteria bacterium]|nr:HAMP domain-containing protein [Betaproteobacteria bacterium]
MRIRVDTLYARLALVLLFALIAGFGTMFLVFQVHTDDQRITNLARNFAVQIRLVEEILRAHPDFEKSPPPGVRLASDPEEGRAAGDQANFLARLRGALVEELGEAVEMRAGSQRDSGFWVRLGSIPQGERWLHFPAPARRHGNHIEPWGWGLISGFVVILVGGMALLWGVQRPLRRLEAAIEQVGVADPPHMDVAGPRETRILAERFNDMVSRLQQFDRDRAEMLVGLAHDLRAPITRLRLQLEMEAGQRREAMIANLEGIDAIVDQFLTFAQGREPEAFAMHSVMEIVGAAVGPYLRHGVSLKIAEDADTVIRVMPNMLQRAIANLLENALEYGSPPFSVEVQRLAGAIVVRVVDHGVGIAPERMELAIQAFTRLDSARRGKGHCGLGLAIADRVARLHGGQFKLLRATPSGLIGELHLPAGKAS